MVLRRLWHLRSARLALGLLTGVALLALLGPLLAPRSPLAGSADVLAHPSAAHLLGTDYLGRDVLSRLLAGSPVSVLGAVMVALIALVVGTLPGILSVYLGPTFEWITLRVVDTLIALPFLLFAVSMTALIGNGITQALVTVGILVAPHYYRVARAAALSVVRSPYVEAATIAGASAGWIVRKHFAAEVIPPVAVALASTMGNGLVVVASLTFLGIGVRPPDPTWGGLLASDLDYLAYQPYAPLFPTALILATVWAFNLLADALRDVTGQSGRVLIESQTAEARRRAGAPPEADGRRATRRLGDGAPPGLRTTPAAAANRSGATVADEDDDAGAVVAVDDLRIANRWTGEELVQGVTFSLRRGQVLGIVGESGSGKTLTCKAMLGILPPGFHVSGGGISLGGRDVAGFTRADWTGARGVRIAAVFQDPGSYLDPTWRVGTQVEEIFRIKKRLRRREARARVLALFEALHLRDPERVFEQYPHQLSGGMLQRVLIASAIALEPAVLIADEATTALDVTVQAEILDLLVDLRERMGLALVLVSHDLAVVAQLCDEVLVMRSGQVVERGPVSEILRRPRHAYTRLLVADHNRYGLERPARDVGATEGGGVEHVS
jgi:peptide/nickel transport system permease protein